MRHLRYPIRYNCPNGADENTCKQQRDALAKELEDAIRAVLNSQEFKDSLPKPPELPAFPAAVPQEGKGKFRAKGSPLGVYDGIGLLGEASHDVILSEASPIWLRVMPNMDNGRRWRSTELQQLVRQIGATLLLPMNAGSLGYNYVRNQDGFGMYAVINRDDKKNITSDMSYIFTTGEIWAIDAYLLDVMKPNNAIPNVESNFCQALERYSEFLLTKLEIKPPYKWISAGDRLPAPQRAP